MKKSFRNPTTGVLTAHGFCESNGSDTARDEPDDFSLEPGKWQLVGDTWLPYNPVRVPQAVTMRQARLALLQAGLLEQVDTSINAMESPVKEAARIEWEYSQEVHRDRPFVQRLGEALGLTAAKLDDLFVLADTL